MTFQQTRIKSTLKKVRGSVMPIIQHLIADEFGTHVGKYQGRLKITRKGETLMAAPLMHLETVSILSSGVSVSADALEACAERGIPIFFVDAIGRPYASVYAAGLAGTVITRREQMRAYDDERAFVLAVTFARGKIRNQALTLKYLARARKETSEGEALLLAAGDVTDHLRELDQMPPEHIDVARGRIMGLEGSAAHVYWAAARIVLPERYGWKSRETRGASDPINSLLNYGYGILYGQVERALVLAGLDPYAGFLHVDRPGKPSLVLDLIEEFRAVAVDRVVFGLAIRDYKIQQDERGMLTEVARRSFAEHILKHLESKLRHEGERYPLRAIVQTQARRLAAYLRGEREAYQPYRGEV